MKNTLSADCLKEIDNSKVSLSDKYAVAGFDGFIDIIVHPVDKRTGQGDKFSAMPTITTFGNRILEAAGKSSNIELYPVMEKLGGNGPIMSNALLTAGVKVKYFGALGKPTIASVFEDFAKATDAVSIANPGVTHALEFKDGKVMLGKMRDLDDVNAEKLLEACSEKELCAIFEKADLIAPTNWTMLSNLNSIFDLLLEKVLPKISKKDRFFFFDLCDPQKRTNKDIEELLTKISAFDKFGKTILGLNLKEAEQIYRIMGHTPGEEYAESLKEMAAGIRKNLNIYAVVVHPTRSAACATAEGEHWVPGPFVEHPKLTTGAGDVFSAGFMMAQLLGLSIEASLTLAVCTSGFYVRNAKSPTLDDLKTFLKTVYPES